MKHCSKEGDGRISRSSFLKMAGALGAGLLGGCLPGKSVTHDPPDPNAIVTVYKLSSRGMQACKACRNHAANKIFATVGDAVGHRAHPGCSCKIKTLKVTQAEYGSYFAGGGVYDRRG